jgi:transcriptional regulator with XRE-family HTH domain
MARRTLGEELRAARTAAGLSLREVERRSGIHNAHLSQIENGRILKPEMALLWELAGLYGIDYPELLRLAGHARGGAATPGEARERMTVALRALDELSPTEREDAMRYLRALEEAGER